MMIMDGIVNKKTFRMSSPILKAPLLLGTVELHAIHHPLVTDINLINEGKLMLEFSDSVCTMQS